MRKNRKLLNAIFRETEKNLQNTAVLVGKSKKNGENPHKNRVLFLKRM
jgi:hypothetical protein